MPKMMRARERKEGMECYMKKEYVKPVIESEEFVANEYVAACWIVTCKNHPNESFIYHQDPTEAKDEDNFEYISDGIFKGWWYDGDELGDKFWGMSHHVDLVQTNSTNHKEHPNASA